MSGSLKGMKNPAYSKVKSIDQDATSSHLSSRDIILCRINNEGT